MSSRQCCIVSTGKCWEMAKRVGLVGLTCIICNFWQSGLIFSTHKEILTRGLKSGGAGRVWPAGQLFIFVFIFLFFPHNIWALFDSWTHASTLKVYVLDAMGELASSAQLHFLITHKLVRIMSLSPFTVFFFLFFLISYPINIFLLIKYSTILNVILLSLIKNSFIFFKKDFDEFIHIKKGFLLYFLFFCGPTLQPGAGRVGPFAVTYLVNVTISHLTYRIHAQYFSLFDYKS